MNTKFPYTNTHTHQLATDDTVSIFNLDALTAPPEEHYFSAGIHPWRIAATNIPEALVQLNELALTKNMLAIGECGLDRLIDIPLVEQALIFEQQLKRAEELQKPVIIHCVRAFDELIRIKRDRNHGTSLVIHGFNNNSQIGAELIKNGFKLSFGKALLQENSNAQQVFKTASLEDVFLETDNSTIHINAIFEKAASLKQMNLEDLKEQIYNNFIKTFKA